MLESFAELLGQLFPAIDPETREKFVRAVREHRPIAKELYAPIPPPGICQGDIVEPVPIRFLEGDGAWYELVGPGLILSNTCDASNQSHVEVAACFPFSTFAGDASISRSKDFLPSVKANEVSNFFFLPAVPKRGDLVADLGLASPLSRAWLEAELSNGRTRRLSAFSQFGYYLFCAKLSIHFLRPETEEIVRPSAVPRFRNRLIEAARILAGGTN